MKMLILPAVLVGLALPALADDAVAVSDAEQPSDPLLAQAADAASDAASEEGASSAQGLDPLTDPAPRVVASVAVNPPVAATAGWYGDVAGSYTALQDSDLFDGRLAGGRGELETDGGFGITGALGYAYGNGLRVEVEIGYRQNDLDRISVGGFGTTATGPVNGEISALSGMANVYYDYPINGGLIPYIGGGIGAASVDIDSTALAADDSETAFAYQFMGGLRYPLNERLAVRVGYRFFTTEDVELQNTDVEYISHNVEVGLTYAF